MRLLGNQLELLLPMMIFIGSILLGILSNTELPEIKIRLM